MRRLAPTAFGASITVSIAVLLQAPAGAQPERSAAPPQRVTLSARPTTLRWAQGATLFGAVDSGRADEEVTLQAKDCGQRTFVNVTAILTHEGGTWTTQFGRGITTTVRAVWKGALSAPITLHQQPYVELRQRSAKRYTVAVVSRGQFWHKRVLVQRRSGGGWTTLRSVLLTDTYAPPGTGSVRTEARFTISVPKGSTLRAMLPGDQARPCFLATASDLVRT